jgi:hypothetical protein
MEQEAVILGEERRGAILIGGTLWKVAWFRIQIMNRGTRNNE